MIILNPFSGSKRNLKDIIATELEAHEIKCEFYETTGKDDAKRMAREFEIDGYSALIAVGGDGTIHEVINGLMWRQDGKRIPLGFIPNGTGNDICLDMKILDYQTALKFIVAGDLIKNDLSKVLIDFESEQEI